jgi:hypothetical protein
MFWELIFLQNKKVCLSLGFKSVRSKLCWSFFSGDVSRSRRCCIFIWKFPIVSWVLLDKIRFLHLVARSTESWKNKSKCEGLRKNQCQLAGERIRNASARQCNFVLGVLVKQLEIFRIADKYRLLKSKKNMEIIWQHRIEPLHLLRFSLAKTKAFDFALNCGVWIWMKIVNKNAHFYHNWRN